MHPLIAQQPEYVEWQRQYDEADASMPSPAFQVADPEEAQTRAIDRVSTMTELVRTERPLLLRQIGSRIERLADEREAQLRSEAQQACETVERIAAELNELKESVRLCRLAAGDRTPLWPGEVDARVLLMHLEKGQSVLNPTPA
jgi:hypothetical protein